MEKRTRRLRGNEIVRKMTRETRISSDALIYPLFIREGTGIEEEIASLKGQIRYSPDRLAKGIEAGLQKGVRSFLLFGIPKSKDDAGTGAYSDDGVVQKALRLMRASFGNDVHLITDVCLCEYTSHGHCGLIVDRNPALPAQLPLTESDNQASKASSEHYSIDNDSTIQLLARTAISHLHAGSDMVAPSAMMDKTIAALRASMDQEGFTDSPIMSYAAKYASSYYGPFRDAAGSAPQFGDRKTYQMDYHNGREALKRIRFDIEEGADIVIVKPALPCLDIIAKAREMVTSPIAAYSVSGEYAMMQAAADLGYIDRYAVMCESAASVFRAGADILITYCAKELAEAIAKGDIG